LRGVLKRRFEAGGCAVDAAVIGDVEYQGITGLIIAQHQSETDPGEKDQDPSSLHGRAFGLSIARARQVPPEVLFQSLRR